MESVSEQKVLVRISWIQDKKGKPLPEVSMNLDDLCEIGPSVTSKIEKFKKKYFKLIQDSKKIASFKNKKSTKKKKFSSLDWWKLGKLIDDFNKNIENEFEILNYTEAIYKALDGFQMSDTEVGVICQFARYFDRSEVSEKISIAHYRDFTWKRNQLLECGILEQEKLKLEKLGKEGKLPDHKKYRKYLQEVIAKGRET